ncbi:hypothetical protein SDJN02_12111, partial [Cucurbita argyrosperma subsp. argyrosperma]
SLSSSSRISNPSMSLAALTCNSNPNTLNLSHRSIRRSNGVLFMAIPTRRSINSRSLSLPKLLFRIPWSSSKCRRNPISPRVKFVSPVMEWQNCTAKMEVDIPASVAYKCYSDREAIPKWMPFISSVKRCCSILSKRPIILPRRNFLFGRFQLTVSYEVPPLLSPVASALQPLLERLLKRGLESFATFAKKYQTA